MSTSIFLQNYQLLSDKFGGDGVGLPFRAIIDERNAWAAVMVLPKGMTIYDYHAKKLNIPCSYIGGNGRTIIGFFTEEDYVEVLLRL